MKALTVRLPERLAAESRERRISKSDGVRERLERAKGSANRGALASISDLVGSVEGLPVDLSARRKTYLRSTSHGRKRAG